jgi:hypothetical protein
MRKNHIIILLLAIVSLLYIFSLFHRVVDIDDAWDGDFAYWQAKLGYVKSELMHGWAQQEIRLICHHKLLTLQGAFVINTFGFSLFNLKAISLIYFLLFLFIYYKHTYKKILPPFYFYLSLLLFISNALMFRFSFVFRPELALMTLGFISYLFLDKALKQQNGLGLVVLSGLFAGIGVATHLNGIIFIIAGGLLLFINKKYLYGIIFGVAALPAAAIYFYDFTSTYNLQFWFNQISEITTDESLSNMPAGISNLVNLLNEHLRFFHSPIEISFSLLFIATLFLTYKNLQTHKNLVIYAAILVIFLGLISVHKGSKYAIVYLPYLMIILATSLNFLFDQKQSKNIRFQKNSLSLATILLVVYLFINIFYDVKLSIKKFYASENREFVTKYIHEKTNNLKIVAPIGFIFNEITNFESIQASQCYTDMDKTNKLIYKQGFLDLTKKFERDYIILSEEFINRLGLSDFTVSDFQLNGFEVITKSNDLLILKNTERYNRRNKNQILNVK